MARYKRLISLTAAVCLLAGCAASSGSSNSSEPKLLDAAPTPTPQTLAVYVQTESPAAEAALQAYADAQNVTVSYTSAPDKAGLAVLDAPPQGGDYRTMNSDTLLSAAAARNTETEAGDECLPLGQSLYGYWADGTKLTALLGENAADDLQKATWKEWYAFVTAVQDWIAKPSAAQITLNGKDYTLPEECPAALSGLESVFALPTAQQAMTGTAYTATLLCAGDTRSTDTLTGPLYGLAAAFMMEFDACSNATTVEGAISQLAVGSSLFYRGSWADLAGQLGADKCTCYLPVPFKGYWEDSDLNTEDYTVDALLNSMTVGETVYLAIPAAADEQAAKAGASAMLWLYTTEEGEQTLTQDLLLVTPWGSRAENGEAADTWAAWEENGTLPAPVFDEETYTALTEAAVQLKGDSASTGSFLDLVLPLLCGEEENEANP